MKRLLYISALSIAFCACAKEEPELTHKVQYVNDFVVEDVPDDSVQHERYLIYKDFGVPVFFNDTIKKRESFDRSGNPVYSYETVDLNWSYTDYQGKIKYRYKYLTDKGLQMRALKITRRYLSKTSKPMRPFSIMLADTLTISSPSTVTRPLYHVGYRTLALSQIARISDDEIDNVINKTIRSMVYDRVSSNKDLCAQFGEKAVKSAWYRQRWSDLGNCPNLAKWVLLNWAITANSLFNDPPYETFDNEDAADMLEKLEEVGSREQAESIRQAMLQEIGNYGFIRGEHRVTSGSPKSLEEDCKFFVEAIMFLGEQGFKQRYGHLPLVMEKYNILAKYITNVLQVDLNYNGITEHTNE